MANLEWGVSVDAIEALKQHAGALENLIGKFDNDINEIERAYSENAGGLGAHSEDIEALIEELKDILKDCHPQLQKLSLKMAKSAMIRQAHIDASVYKKVSTSTGNLAVDSFVTDVAGLKSTMSLGEGDSETKQLAGVHKQVRQKDGPGFESHHIPSAAALKQFGIDTDGWPTIALTKEDHAKTDSYRGKQSKKGQSIFPDAPQSGTYKEESVEMIARGGGFFELVRDEILNIREQCGDKYDGAIAQYLDEIVAYVKKNGVPQKK